jgi:hypothetical protein
MDSMPAIVWPSNSEIELIDSVRDAIGREVVFYIVASSTPCPICVLDPITDTSTNSFCPVCSGEYWIPIYSGVSILSHITWGGTDALQWQTGGQLFDGDCRVQIKYTPSNVLVIDEFKWVEVDGHRMTKIKVLPRGVQQLNRLLIDLQLDE